MNRTTGWYYDGNNNAANSVTVQDSNFLNNGTGVNVVQYFGAGGVT
jgi:hypothetical protein